MKTNAGEIKAYKIIIKGKEKELLDVPWYQLFKRANIKEDLGYFRRKLDGTSTEFIGKNCKKEL